MTTFHLIRHAAHAHLGHTLTGRTPGVSLSEKGCAQAAHLADALAEIPLVAIISSPLERAQQTAAPLASRHALPLQIDPALDEIDYGAWSAQPFATLAGPEWQAWNIARSLAPTPGGETMLEVQARAMAAIQRWSNRYPEGDVAIVSHQDVLKSVVAQFLGMPLDLLHRLELSPARRTIITTGPGWAKVELING